MTCALQRGHGAPRLRKFSASTEHSVCPHGIRAALTGRSRQMVHSLDNAPPRAGDAPPRAGRAAEGTDAVGATCTGAGGGTGDAARTVAAAAAGDGAPEGGPIVRTAASAALFDARPT